MKAIIRIIGNEPAALSDADKTYLKHHRRNAQIALRLMNAANCSAVHIDDDYIWRQDVRDSGFYAECVVNFFMTHTSLI